MLKNDGDEWGRRGQGEQSDGGQTAIPVGIGAPADR